MGLIPGCCIFSSTPFIFSIPKIPPLTSSSPFPSPTAILPLLPLLALQDSPSMADTSPQIQPIGGGSAASAPSPEIDESDPVELILFHANDCYVYLIPPRMSAASYRADEWDVNKWAWEGALKVVSKGEECIIKLEDRTTGELYARAFLRNGEPHPVETVIDSSRYFVLRVEENIGGRLRHAFIGIGFRERPQAYDFQAALHDHMKYLDKKKTAEEMEQHYQTSSVDYSLKEGETLVLQLKNNKGRPVKSAFFEQGLSNLSPDGKSSRKEGMLCLKPPPPPPVPLSASNPVQQAPASHLCLQSSATDAIPLPTAVSSKETSPIRDAAAVLEDDFGDFQAAG